MRLLEADEERETRRVQRPKGNETIRRLMTRTHVSRLTTATAPKRRGKGAKLPSWSPSLSLRSPIFSPLRPRQSYQISTTSIDERVSWRTWRGRERATPFLRRLQTECEFDARRRRHRRRRRRRHREYLLSPRRETRPSLRGCVKPPRDRL